MRREGLKSRYQSGRQTAARGLTLIRSRGDNLLLLSALMLAAVGLVMVYSSSSFVAARYNKVDWFFFSRQLLFTVIGLAALLIGARLDVGIYKRWGRVLLFGFTILLALQLVTPLGPVISSTRRWIDLGPFNLQTSDVVRCLIVIFLAQVLTDEPELLLKLDKRMGRLLLIIAVPIILTVLEPDLTGALMMALTAGLLLFLGGMKLLHLLGIGSAGLAVAGLWVMRMPYQRERIQNFAMRVLEGGSGDNYQTFQSLLGFGRGGLFGVGLGQGKQKMLFLPEPHTDFIFSIIGEELGLIRTSLVIALFLILALRSFKMLRRQPDRFNLLLGAGLIGSIITFALVNMYVATGLLPVTGLPLPFISSGGTNLVISLWSVGVLWRLSRYAGDYD